MQLIEHLCCVASCDRLLSVLPPSRATNNDVTELDNTTSKFAACRSRSAMATSNGTLLYSKLHENAEVVHIT